MSKINKVVLITGCAGFIGAALAKRFLAEDYKVIGIDNINDYYDQNLKLSRLEEIKNSLSSKRKILGFSTKILFIIWKPLRIFFQIISLI